MTIAEAAAPPRVVAFTAPTGQIRAILEAAETVRVRLVLLSAMTGDQRAGQLQRLAGELRRLGEALRDPGLDGRLSRFGSALALMGEAFRNPGPELAGWCDNVLDEPLRRLAAHLQALGAVLYVSAEAVRAQPGCAYDPELLDRQLDRAHVERLKRSPLPRRRW